MKVKYTPGVFIGAFGVGLLLAMAAINTLVL